MTPHGRCLAWILSPLLLLTSMTGVNARDVTPASAVVGPVPAAATQVLSESSRMPPGTLLETAPLIDRPLPSNAQAWRIQYTTTAPDGSSATAVATVLAPRELPPGALPVIAWNHGAVGLVQRCLPSALADPWRDMPAVADAIEEGWLVVATDYQTDGNGIHPFLIGEGEGRSTLDAVRALRQMPGLLVDHRTIVWGHSQGGHAALWTGMIAPTYAPDVTLKGVVALSPVTTLVSLLDRQSESLVAPLLGSWVAAAYSAYYPDVVYDTIVSSAALVLGRDLAIRCPPEPLDGVAIALMLGELGNEPLLNVPAPESFRARLAENEPDGELAVPAVVAQGLDDTVVLPEVTASFVADRCADGEAITFWQLPDQDHLSLVQPGSPLEGPLIAWTRDRFAGEAAASTCSEHVIARPND